MSSIRGCDRAIKTYCAMHSAPVHPHPLERAIGGGWAAFLTSRSVRKYLALLLGLMLILGPTANAVAIDVVADDTADEYLISGPAYLDSSFGEATAATDCADCHWRVLVICASGSLDDRRGCDQLPLACPRIAEVWRADAVEAPPIGDPLWQYRGVMCLTHPPVLTREVHAQLPELVRQQVPPLRAGSRPHRITVTNLPTAFFSGQPERLDPELRVAGAVVRLHLEPAWTWDFGHGQPVLTHRAGTPQSTSPVRHRFPRRANYRVRVDARWHATYDVNGIPGSPVPDDITQSAWFDLQVREARRFLTPRRTL